MTDPINNAHCLNCNHPYPEGANHEEKFYCSNCGQANNESKLSAVRLLKDAASTIFNLDSRLVHTFRDILYPSKLTRTYIAGKRRYYVNPVRLFIFILLALVALSIFSIDLDNTDIGVDKYYANVERSKMMEEFSDLIDTTDISGHEQVVDTIKKKLFFGVRELEKDTLGKNGPNFQMMGKDVDEYGISRYDGLHLSPDELFEKYEITNFWEQLNVKQFIRVMTDPAGGIKYIVKNMTWALFLTVILISLFMKLLYIRNHYYLVEHIVLVLNSHSLLFLIVAINILFRVHITGEAEESTFELLFTLASFFIVLIIQFLTIKKYYQQGFLKTLLKMALINMAYLTIFFFTAFLVSLISLLLY